MSSLEECVEYCVELREDKTKQDIDGDSFLCYGDLGTCDDYVSKPNVPSLQGCVQWCVDKRSTDGG